MINVNILKKFLSNCQLSVTPNVKVHGESMYPVLRDKDRIIIVSVPIYKIGDIVLFRYKEEGYIVHRIVYCGHGKIICKGDNSFRLEYINNNDIVGRVSKIYREDVEISPKQMMERYIEMSYNIGLLAEKTSDLRNVVESHLYKQYRKEYVDL